MGGWDVLQASDGNKALEIAAQHSGEIDLLLSDIVIGGGPDGIELAQRVSRSWPGTKVLLMSGFSQDAALQNSWPFIAKPFTPGALLQKINDVLLER